MREQSPRDHWTSLRRRGLPHESTRWHTARRLATQRVSAEGQEGLRAFLEDRPPDWSVGDVGDT